MRPALGTGTLGALLALAGFLLDAEPLLVAGAVLALLAFGSALWVALAARGAVLERSLAERRVLEDAPLEVRLDARARLPWPGATVAEPLLAEPAALPALARDGRVRVAVRFGRRGRRVLATPELRIGDPLGLAARAVAGPAAAEVLVLPRTFPLRAAAAGPDGAAAAGLEALSAGVAATEFDGLRPYREGAPAARIHWPALARNAGLLERRLRPESDTAPLVVLDAGAPASGEALDAAVRAAASLVLHLARDGGCALLLPGERRVRPVDRDLAAWPGVHARLALVEAGPGPALGALGTRRGPVLYVAARALSRPPAAAARSAGGRCALVLPSELASGTPVFTVAGCHGMAARRQRRAAA